MPNIIRIRNLEQEKNLSGITFPIDKDSYIANAKQVTGDDLKDWILSGFTGSSGSGSSGSSGTSGHDGLDGIDGTGESGTSGTSGVNGTSGSSGSSGISGTSGSSGSSPCVEYPSSNIITILNATTSTTTLPIQYWFILSPCIGSAQYYTGPYSTYIFSSGNIVQGASNYYTVVTATTTQPINSGINISVTLTSYNSCYDTP